MSLLAMIATRKLGIGKVDRDIYFLSYSTAREDRELGADLRIACCSDTSRGTQRGVSRLLEEMG